MKKYQGLMRAPTGKKHFFTGEIADDFASAGRRSEGRLIRGCVTRGVTDVPGGQDCTVRAFARCVQLRGSAC